MPTPHISKPRPFGRTISTAASTWRVLLGFVQLSVMSQAVVRTRAAAELAEPVAALVRQIERALANLSAIRQAALA